MPSGIAATDKLFLGIDHTAIVISDTDASLRFYRDVLGLQVVGESENYGPEQERLNNVFGARLRITSLRAASGPGVEFLEYLAPARWPSVSAGGEGQRPHPLANQVLGDQRGASRAGSPESPGRRSSRPGS